MLFNVSHLDCATFSSLNFFIAFDYMHIFFFHYIVSPQKQTKISAEKLLNKCLLNWHLGNEVDGFALVHKLSNDIKLRVRKQVLIHRWCCLNSSQIEYCDETDPSLYQKPVGKCAILSYL